MISNKYIINGFESELYKLSKPLLPETKWLLSLIAGAGAGQLAGKLAALKADEENKRQVETAGFATGAVIGPIIYSLLRGKRK